MNIETPRKKLDLSSAIAEGNIRVLRRHRHFGRQIETCRPWRFVDYWEMTHDPDLSQYHHTKA